MADKHLYFSDGNVKVTEIGTWNAIPFTYKLAEILRNKASERLDELGVDGLCAELNEEIARRDILDMSFAPDLHDGEVGLFQGEKHAATICPDGEYFWRGGLVDHLHRGVEKKAQFEACIEVAVTLSDYDFPFEIEVLGQVYRWGDAYELLSSTGAMILWMGGGMVIVEQHFLEILKDIHNTPYTDLASAVNRVQNKLLEVFPQDK